MTDPAASMRFRWAAPGLVLEFAAGNGPVRLVDIVADGVRRRPLDEDRLPVQPLVEVHAPRYGHRNGSRLDGSVLGGRLRLVERHEEPGVLVLLQRDAASGLRASTRFEALAAAPAVRVVTTLGLDEGAEPLDVWSVSSLATGAVISDDLDEIEVWRAATDWSAENRWQHESLRAQGLSAIERHARGETSRGRIAATSAGAWSSATWNPAGAAVLRTSGVALAWQIEHNGAWHWELGETPDWDHGVLPVGQRIRSSEPAGAQHGDNTRDTAYLALHGPVEQEHQWSIRLAPGREFTTVPVTLGYGASLDDAFGALAAHRRAARRRHPQNDALPVVFNDYMNTLEGDPTDGKLLPLIDAAAAAGAEYFCIDAGWYDDTAGWWASVGDWVPSTARFSNGLAAVIDHIRVAGLVPGLWVEPEVVGVTSRAAVDLPDDAFLTRRGVRIRERDRYFLDLRSPAARNHLDRAIDRLIAELGIGYFKFDYNVTPGAGTEVDVDSVGQGLLEHNRALVTWLQALLDRHPTLVVENCGSGAMRSDFAMLGTLALQSTSDQTDPLLYPAIAVGALAHILPEQAGNWAYPQPEMDDERIDFTMAVGLAGRLYLSGVLSGMDARQLARVRAAVEVHHATKGVLARSTPRFPTGLPSWDDQWLSVAFDAESSDRQTLLVVWHLPAATGELRIPLPHLGDAVPSVEQLHPTPGAGATWRVAAEPGAVIVSAPDGLATARMFRLRS